MSHLRLHVSAGEGEEVEFLGSGMYKTEVFIPRTERLVLLYDADPNFGAAKLIRLGKTVFYE